jgi:hypothetical protein
LPALIEAVDQHSKEPIFPVLIGGAKSVPRLEAANGEGRHNNHHGDPRSARHGHCWWEIDNTYLTIRVLLRLGLASHVITPSLPGSPELAGDRRSPTGL